jgi:hypothetical protein
VAVSQSVWAVCYWRGTNILKLVDRWLLAVAIAGAHTPGPTFHSAILHWINAAPRLRKLPRAINQMPIIPEPTIAAARALAETVVAGTACAVNAANGRSQTLHLRLHRHPCPLQHFQPRNFRLTEFDTRGFHVAITIAHYQRRPICGLRQQMGRQHEYGYKRKWQIATETFHDMWAWCMVRLHIHAPRTTSKS